MLANARSTSVSHIRPISNGRRLVRLVYVVLEPQYQSAVAAGVHLINRQNPYLAFQVDGFLLEELRDSQGYERFQTALAEADIFFASLIFVEDLANKVAQAVEPQLSRIKVSVVFPSMPQVMRLSKVGSFNLESIGQSKGAISQFMKNRKEKNPGPKKGGGSFQEGMLKMVQTLPKILKYLPINKAQDARNFMLSYQYWLGGSPENIENLLLMLVRNYFPDSSSQITFEPPVEFPDMGIWHPLAPEMFTESKGYWAWYNERQDIPPELLDPLAPTVGLVMQRTRLITGDDAHYVSIVSEFEAQGARIIPVFSGGLDASKPVEKYYYNAQGQVIVDTVVSLTGFPLVGGPAQNDPDTAIEALSKLNRPYMVALPLVFQTTSEWQSSELGLHPVQVALQVALPELDGAIEPIIMSGRDGMTGRAIPLQDRIELVVGRALKWCVLRRKPRVQKKIALTVFSFPPDKGNVGTAAYLNVFASIYNVMTALKANGYAVENLPESPDALLLEVLNDVRAQISSPELSVAARLSVEEYEKITPYAESLEPSWGPAPGPFNNDGKDLLVYGKHYGNVFIGVQPSFGYEGDPMRLLFDKNCTPHHGFAAYYSYLEKVWNADAVIHFGTHGALEFMPGKQIGMSSTCYPDRLIGTLPNLYYYSVNNPSEGTIAKRRSYASIISYLTPPAENAGLYKGLKELQGTIASYRDLRETDKAGRILEVIVEQVKALNLDRDVVVPENFPNLTIGDTFVGLVYKSLMEIEERLVPCDLHTIGVPPAVSEVVDTLAGVASFDRPEVELSSLQRLLAQARGWDWDETNHQAERGDLEALAHQCLLNTTAREAVRALVQARADNQGRVSKVSLLNFLHLGGGEPWLAVLKEAGFTLEAKQVRSLFQFLEEVLTNIVADNELGALLRGLDGEYLTPGPGGDTVRNPAVLPTGRNTYALDPQSIPTRPALRAAQDIVERMLTRYRADNNNAWPETIACVLWGTDNIKTYGEALAQVLVLLGVNPLPDALGRINRLEIIPLEQLGRPRIDAVVSASGIFRDLFPNQMDLLDRAVKLVAELHEPVEQNYVRKHALAQAAELGISVRQAATRIFSNAAGSYGANVNFAVENGAWESEDQLHDMYLTRKSFAYGATELDNKQMRSIHEASLKTVDSAFQNLDSAEVGLSDVNNYFETLGSVSGIVEKMRGKKPAVYMADTTTVNAKVRTLEENIRLESRVKLLNPKWYEGMLKNGFEGVREIQYRLTNTYGFSATAHAVDDWVYDETAETYMNDPKMAERMADLNPNAFRKMVGTLLEANGRGYWDSTPEQIEKLQELYQDLEDKIEGIG
ncbi:magnesium chelatase subunit H [Anthocerotibacter panamensis]|uniref:magnesium chelatase subunit H n=1 Tax=Anthocerotibacter panamensis TaxID=2857077 RepID=UPI001C401DC3|nr:magnesium chelatase subunit H [Anthocerotibacter panamensis]